MLHLWQWALSPQPVNYECITGRSLTPHILIREGLHPITPDPDHLVYIVRVEKGPLLYIPVYVLFLDGYYCDLLANIGLDVVRLTVLTCC